LHFRDIATASFKPWQQRQSPVCLLSICPFIVPDRANPEFGTQGAPQALPSGDAPGSFGGLILRNQLVGESTVISKADGSQARFRHIIDL